jgi:hypothetical protein
MQFAECRALSMRLFGEDVTLVAQAAAKDRRARKQAEADAGASADADADADAEPVDEGNVENIIGEEAAGAEPATTEGINADEGV